MTLLFPPLVLAVVTAFIHSSTGIGEPGIQCVCDNCKETNYTCVTDGLCYAQALRQDDGTLKYTYKCLDESKFFPPTSPFICRSTMSSPQYSYHCCYTNFCNKDVKPTLPTLNEMTPPKMLPHSNLPNEFYVPVQRDPNKASQTLCSSFLFYIAICIALFCN